MNNLNLVLVTVDCLRYDRCGFNGHHRETTPVLDELASESYVFDNAYATGPYTTESVPGIIAGQHSYNGAHFGEHLAWKAIAKDSLTLASYLSEHEYSTSAVLTNPHITRDRNFHKGFDRFRNLEASDDDPRDTDDRGGDEGRNIGSVVSAVLSKSRSRIRGQRSLVNPYVASYVAYRYAQYRSGWPTAPAAEVIGDAVEEFTDRSEPILHWTHLMDLHAPINPRTVHEGGLVPRGNTLKYLLSDAARASQIHTPTYDLVYDSALRYVDSCIDELVETLRDNGQWENTVLILTSDHGEVLSDRYGIYGHPRHYLYDELLHVPLLVRVPGFEGERLQQPVSLGWIHELVAELLELPPGDFPARSGVDSLLDDTPGDRNVVVSDTLDGTGHSVSIRDDKYKLLGHRAGYERQEEEYPYINRDVLFRYASDVGERNPLPVSKRPDLGTVIDSIQVDPEAHPEIEGRFDPEVEEQLRDLGYTV